MPAAGALAALSLLATACAGVRTDRGGTWRETGLASWYGTDFHGRRTANGERYDMYAMTAAHRTLPFGTRATVTHRRTGRSVRVRINDRGPFVDGRVIDLSYAAARRLGSAAEGVAPVALEADVPAGRLSPPPAPGAASALRGRFSVQVGAFGDRGNALALLDRLGGEPAARVVAFEDRRGTWWRVRFGLYESDAAAREAAGELASRGYPGFVVADD